ncbi:MAG: sulfate adenylyltransferase [DPANN group archaeon]|nr:sulfate adenylyltransferase [DPANN group archaeon]
MLKPHGNRGLVNSVLTADDAAKFSGALNGFQKLEVSDELLLDARNIANGFYSPLDGFMCSEDFDSVLNCMSLKDGTLWPIPIVFDLAIEAAKLIKEGSQIILTQNNKPVAVMQVEEKFRYDKIKYAQRVFGTTDAAHPGVAQVFAKGDVLISGKVSVIDNNYGEFSDFVLTPASARKLFSEKGWRSVVAFQTRNPPHRAHEYLQRCALEIVDGLLINPVVGKKKVGDFKDEIILNTYKHIVENYLPASRALLGVLPQNMRYAGPKEAILHAIIRKNLGCTHFIVGRDHAGVGNYYGTYEAQQIFDGIEDVGIKILKFENSYYCKSCGQFGTDKTCRHPESEKIMPKGTIVREMIKTKTMPELEFMRPDIAKIILEHQNPYVA